jgi:hypothetical protein
MPNIIMWDYGSSQLIVTAAAIGQLVWNDRPQWKIASLKSSFYQLANSYFLFTSVWYYWLFLEYDITLTASS